MSTPEEIVPGVVAVSQGFVNAFIVLDEATTLVDTGVARRIDSIEGALRSSGRERVDNIALTHHHPDHRGGAFAFATGARVFVHSLDAPVVRGDRKPPGPAVGGWRRGVAMALRPVVERVAGEPKPVVVHQEIADGEHVADVLRVVHTPGHTAGHVSFLFEERRLLFVGDAAQNRSDVALPPPFFTEDMEQAKRTLAKIAALDFDVAVFGHGKVLKGRANAEFRKLVDRLAS